MDSDPTSDPSLKCPRCGTERGDDGARCRACDEVIAAIRATHLTANIDQFEREPDRWGAPQWQDAWVDPGGTLFGPGPYLKVPIRGGAWDGTVQRVYAPAPLRRRLAPARLRRRVARRHNG